MRSTFRLIQTIRDGVIALRDIDYTAYGMRGPFRSQHGERMVRIVRYVEQQSSEGSEGCAIRRVHCSILLVVTK